MSQLLEGIKNQYLTYPYQVQVPFANYVKGEVIKVKNVEERGDTFVVIFDNGGSLKMSAFDKYLKVYDVDNSIAMVDTLGDKPLIDKSDEKFKDIEPTVVNPKFPMRESKFPMNETSLNKTKNKQVIQKSDTSYFSKFNSKERKLLLDIKVKLPAESLLKAMYENAVDNDEFLNEFSNYIYNTIDISVIKDSAIKLLKNNKK